MKRFVHLALATALVVLGIYLAGWLSGLAASPKTQETISAPTDRTGEMAASSRLPDALNASQPDLDARVSRETPASSAVPVPLPPSSSEPSVLAESSSASPASKPLESSAGQTASAPKPAVTSSFASPAAEVSSMDPQQAAQPLLAVGSEKPESNKPDLALSSESVMPGGILVLTASGFDKKTAIEVDNPFGGKPAFFDVGEIRTALIGIKSATPAGSYTLTASAEGVSRKFSVEVTARKFDEQFLTVEQSVVDKTVGSDEANVQYNNEVQPLKFFADAHPAWEGSFLLPIDGAFRITTTFGMRRTTNGVPGDRHGGIDYACPTGTPVLATNAGVVKLAKNIMITGNTVMIEHGMGLKSWYYHMNSVAVEKGDRVEKGQIIGTVGSTGFSTGPHLHFAISIFSVYVDPEPFYEKAPL